LQKTDDKEKIKNNRRRQNNFKEDPFCLVHPSVHSSIQKFFGMSDEFVCDHFFGRSMLARKVYFLNEGVASIVNNPLNHKLKVVHTGLRCFESRHEMLKKASAAEGGEELPGHVYRVCQEGVYHVRSMMSKQVLDCSYVQFAHLLKTHCTKLTELREGGLEGAMELLSQIDATKDGCVVAVCDFTKEANKPDGVSVEQPYLCMCLWRTANSVTLMLSKEDKIHYSHMLNVEYVEYVKKQVVKDAKEKEGETSKMELDSESKAVEPAAEQK